MSTWPSPQDELGTLTAALCDGEITPEEAHRLEQLVTHSEAARRWFRRYVQLHAELYWEHASGGRVGLPAGQTAVAELAAARRPNRLRRLWRAHPGSLAFSAVAVAALVVVALHWGITRSGHSTTTPVAQVTQTKDAQWSGAPADSPKGQRLSVGQSFRLQSGLATIAYDIGAEVMLQGPAVLDVTGPSEGKLRSGSLLGRVPHAAAGFAIVTPAGRIVDRGTEFGLRINADSAVELHVFDGRVDVESTASGWSRCVRAGKAVRVVREPHAGIGITSIPCDRRAFAGNPTEAGRPAHSVAALRAMVAAEPQLIHQYTFEGNTPAEKCRDRRGDLDLGEVVMVSGRGAGTIQYTLPGLDSTSNAISPWRSDGSTGVALQSGTVFHPPEEMTVELLLNYSPLTNSREEMAAAAVSTRSDSRHCGFFVAVADNGELVHLFDAEAPWVESGLELTPGDWYYVACTFRTQGESTLVNTYVADVSRGEKVLAHLVRNQLAPGVPSPSPLGIGKGFSNDQTHAYPWPGSLDEVALYQAILPETTLQTHLSALVGAVPGGEKGLVPEK
jgi:hypothetical protein